MTYNCTNNRSANENSRSRLKIQRGNIVNEHLNVKQILSLPLRVFSQNLQVPSLVFRHLFVLLPKQQPHP